MIAMVFHKQYVRQQQKVTSLDLQERCVAVNKPKCNKTFITTNTKACTLASNPVTKWLMLAEHAIHCL